MSTSASSEQPDERAGPRHLAWAQLEQRAARSRGWVHARDARASQVSTSSLRRHARQRNWTRKFPGTVALPGARSDVFATLAAALAWLGAEAYACGTTALWLHGIVDGPSGELHVVIEHDRRYRTPRGVRVHRSRTLERNGDTAVAKGLQTTSVARALVECAADLREARLRAVIIDARQRDAVSIDDVRDVLARMGSVPGAPRLRRLLDELDEAECDSEFEYRMRALIREDPQLPDPDPEQHTVSTRHGKRRLDIAWSRWQVGLACHGFGSHSERHDLERDVDSRNELLDTPWKVLEATWRHLDSGWPKLRDSLLDALRQAGAPV